MNEIVSFLVMSGEMLPVMTNKLDVVSVVAMLDAVDANCVPIGRVARAASGTERKRV